MPYVWRIVTTPTGTAGDNVVTRPVSIDVEVSLLTVEKLVMHGQANDFNFEEEHQTCSEILDDENKQICSEIVQINT